MVDLRKLCVIAAAAVLVSGGCNSDDGKAQPSGHHASGSQGSGEPDSGPHDEDAAVDEGGDLPPPSGATCPTDHAELTYEKFGQAFMTTYCTRCHSSKLKTPAERMNATPDHDFDVYDSIKGMHSHIDRKAAAGPSSTNTSMPPSAPKPSLAERQKLAQWLACEFGPATE